MAGYRSAPWFQGVLLGGFCLVAAIALALGQRMTAPDVAQRMKEDLALSLEQVIPASYRQNDMATDTTVITGDNGPMTIYRARQAGKVSAVAYRTIAQGYGGEIILVMGVDRNGEILGVRVIQHAETPGLGDKIEAAKSSWIDRFKGLSASNTPDGQWAVKKDGGRFDQFSGATITPRGVVKAVKTGLDLFSRYRAQMLDEAKGARPVPAPATSPAQMRTVS